MGDMMANEHAEHAEPNYFAIMVVLTILTIIEIIIPQFISAKLTAGTLLVLLAVVKAVIVALYFMHLRFERSILGVIAMTPMAICVFLIVMLLPDITASTKTYTPPEQPVASETVQH